MRGTTETMGTMLRIEFDEASGQFRQQMVEHPFAKGQYVPGQVCDRETEMALGVAPTVPEEPVPTGHDGCGDSPDPTPIEGLRIVA